MTSGLRAFLDRIVDYAGLFPPAELPLNDAIRNFCAYRESPDAWLLARFICPARLLARLEPHHDALFTKGDPFRFSVLGRGGQDPDAFLSALDEDLSDIDAFQKRHLDRVEIDAVEMRLPGSLVEPGDARAVAELAVKVAELVDETARRVERGREGQLRVWVEAGMGAQWERALPVTIDALAAANARRVEFPGSADAVPAWVPLGFKLRCGGATREAVPSTGQVALVIATCRTARVPLKFTAGLHHPLRHLDPALRVPAHGFLNVFAAGVLARVAGLDVDRIRSILDDGEGRHFLFDERGFSWKGYRASTEEIASARATGVTSFGSCSFDEPRDDLRSLGLLDALAGER